MGTLKCIFTHTTLLADSSKDRPHSMSYIILRNYSRVKSLPTLVHTASGTCPNLQFSSPMTIIILVVYTLYNVYKIPEISGPIIGMLVNNVNLSSMQTCNAANTQVVF